jgi:NADP-dependent 3-hydroxy acid dehydrogenase YdfG
MREWAGKRYWILGAADPIGRAMAHRLSRVGTEVILSSPLLEDLGRLMDELPGRARALSADVADRASLDQVVRGVGEIDGLMVLSDLRLPLTPDDWDAERLEAMCDVNFTGAARAVGVVLPGMRARGSGHVVLSGLHGAMRAMPGAMGYAASRAGAMALAKSLRAELSGLGIDVQLVNLGPIEGRPAEDASAQALSPDEAARRIFEHMNGDTFEAGIGTPAWLARLAG